MNSRRRETYMRAAAVRIWPPLAAGRVAGRGRPPARLRQQIHQHPSRAATRATVGVEARLRRHSSRDPCLIAPQKKSVVDVPRAPPAGTA